MSIRITSIKKRMIRFSELVIGNLLLAVVAGLLLVITPIQAQSLAQQLSGKILLQVEENGEAWYIYPQSKERYFLGRPEDAFEIMRTLGLGITTADLEKIPEGGSSTIGSRDLRDRLSGSILLQVEANGEAWYVFPDDQKRYFLGRPADAFALMRQLGLGISTENLIGIPIALESKIPESTNSTKTSTEGDLDDQYDGDRHILLDKMNIERSAVGLPSYTLVKELSNAAQANANDMNVLGYFDTISPNGKTVKDFVIDANYSASVFAQNITQTNKDLSQVISSWKSEQPASFANVVDPDYEEIGVGINTFEGLPIYVVIFSRSLDSYFNEQTQQLSDLSAVRSEMLNRLNAERLSVGLDPLVFDDLLHQSSQNHTEDMLIRSYYSHDTPEGLTPHDRIKAIGYVPSFTGENIAKGQFSVEEVMDAWMDSPAHRDNILSPNFTEVGFGLSYGENLNGYEIIWSQNFGSPME